MHVRFAYLVCLSLFGATGASAQSVAPGQEGPLADLLPPVPGERICYGRIYTADHLAKHPKQKVARVGFRLTYFRHEPDANAPQGQRNYYFAMTATMLGSARMLKATGECGSHGGTIGCGVECDGGGVRLVPRPGDKILVSLGEGGRIRMSAGCDAEEDAVDLEAGEDDREFLLSRLPDTACPPYEEW